MEPNNNSTPQPGPAPQPEPTPQPETTSEPITSTPPTPTISQPITPASNTSPQLPKSKRKKPIPTIILACTTAIFAGFAVFFGYQYLTSDQPNNTQSTTTETQSTTEPTAPDIQQNEDTLAENDRSDYIYVAQWGVKVKLPNTLASVSYQFRSSSNGTSLYVNGVSCTESCQYLPSFANVFADPDKALFAITKWTDESLQEDAPHGQELTILGEKYYWSGSQAPYSEDQSEFEWEQQSRQLIIDTFTNPDNWSKI